jgi:tetrahydromethanopterin S-methyltransferase subunit F
MQNAKLIAGLDAGLIAGLIAGLDAGPSRFGDNVG